MAEQCKGITRSGTRCKITRNLKNGYCRFHIDQAQQSVKEQNEIKKQKPEFEYEKQKPESYPCSREKKDYLAKSDQFSESSKINRILSIIIIVLGSCLLLSMMKNTVKRFK